MSFKIKDNSKMKKYGLILLVLVCGCGFSGCTQPLKDQEALDHQGYTNCSMGGYDGFGRTGDDFSCDKYTCLDGKGKPVSGSVGCGFNGCSVRTN